MKTDLELLAAWQDGHEDAGSALIERHFDSVCRFFRRKLGDDVQDLIQRTFLDCIEGRERIVGSNFRGYLFGVARNRLYHHLRGLRRKGEAVDMDVHSLADLGTGPGRMIERAQETRQLLEAMSHLPVDLQIVLELTYWEGMAGAEVAEVLDIPANTVRSKLVRARRLLEARLAAARPVPRPGDDTMTTP